MNNYIKSFCCSDTYEDLTSSINRYCTRNKTNPVSISVIFSHGTYVAFVVMEEEDG